MTNGRHTYAVVQLQLSRAAVLHTVRLERWIAADVNNRSHPPPSVMIYCPSTLTCTPMCAHAITRKHHNDMYGDGVFPSRFFVRRRRFAIAIHADCCCSFYFYLFFFNYSVWPISLKSKKGNFNLQNYDFFDANLRIKKKCLLLLLLWSRKYVNNIYREI